MRVAILGGGPAGLYLGYLVKRRDPSAQVRIFEQNPSDATFGFGVVFSDRALEFLNEDDPKTCAAITAHLESWQDITVIHRGQRIRIDGIGFAAIGRLHLLQILQERVRSVGIEPFYNHAVAGPQELADADLIVAADGANSLVRNLLANEFRTTISQLRNRFAWFGTTKRFETLTQTFYENPRGFFNAHHYRYSPQMSTFIVETDEETFLSSGLNRMSEDETREFCEEIFDDQLEGHKLIANKSIWRQFPKIWNDHWSVRNIVLIGDALRTAHFSIGSGTRLAMEDAIALDRALAKSPNDIPGALSDYEQARRPIVEKLVGAANASASWYENFPQHMKLDPIDFVMSYITRSGRVDRERLREVSPQFVEAYEAARKDSIQRTGGRP